MESNVQHDLYKQMVLIRTYEDSSLREYRADKKLVFDLGVGLLPSEMHLTSG